MLVKILPLIALLLVMNGSMLMSIGINNRQERALSVLNSIIPGYPGFLLEPALLYYHIEKAKKLDAAPTDAVTKQKRDGMTALHIAVKKRNYDKAVELIRNGADINATDRYNMTALNYAATNGHVKIAKLLLEGGANVNTKNEFGMTALNYAATNGHLDIAKLLIAKGADVNAKNEFGMTALHSATKNGHVDIAKLLIQLGANIDAQDNYQYTPLHYAVKHDNPDIAILLIINKADTDLKDNFGQTPLDLVDSGNTLHTLDKRIRSGLYQNTRLHIAAVKGNYDKAVELIRNGANINAENEVGRTPLHIAALNGNIEIVNLLIKNEADIDAKDIYNYTPKEIAKNKILKAYGTSKRRFETIANILQEKEDFINLQEYFSRIITE